MNLIFPHLYFFFVLHSGFALFHFYLSVNFTWLAQLWNGIKLLKNKMKMVWGKTCLCLTSLERAQGSEGLFWVAPGTWVITWALLPVISDSCVTATQHTHRVSYVLHWFFFPRKINLDLCFHLLLWYFFPLLFFFFFVLQSLKRSCRWEVPAPAALQQGFPLA